jgi:site-specific recombinase XerD
MERKASGPPRGCRRFLLQRLLGRSTIQATEHYVHLVDEEKLKVAFKEFSPSDLMRA